MNRAEERRAAPTRETLALGMQVWTPEQDGLVKSLQAVEVAKPLGGILRPGPGTLTAEQPPRP